MDDPRGGAGGQLPVVPSLLQMAQGVAPPMGEQYAPQWVKDEWQRRQGGGQADAGARGGAPGGGFNLDASINPANWGPPPPMDAQGNFSRAATGGFWSNRAALEANQQRFGGQLPEWTDERPNTFNWHLLGALGGSPEPGSYVTNGVQISPAKRYYDLHRPISDPATAGSFRSASQFGPGMFWSTTGELGYPGQLAPFAQMWGAGGP